MSQFRSGCKEYHRNLKYLSYASVQLAKGGVFQSLEASMPFACFHISLDNLQMVQKSRSENKGYRRKVVG